MPDKRTPEQPPFDWRGFVDEMRSRRIRRETSRPSDLLQRQQIAWMRPDKKRGWLGGPWPDDFA